MSSRRRPNQRRRPPASRRGGDDDDGSNSSSDQDEGVPHSEKESYETFEPVTAEELQKHSLSNIVGLDEQVRLLRSSIVYPIVYPQVFQDFESSGLRPNVLLYGPAGTGKTDIVLGLAREARATLFKISPSQIQSSFQARSKRNFAIAVETAASRDGFSILFFDEADTLLGSASDGKSAENDTSIVNTFKELIQVGGARSPPRVIVIAATNFPNRITDVGVLSRFGLKMFVGLPVASGPDQEPRLLRAYRTEIFLNIIDKINKTRCGDTNHHRIAAPSDPRLLNDLETMLFFYTPRELEVIAQVCWTNVDVSPFKLDEFRYDPLPGRRCTNVYRRVWRPRTPKSKEMVEVWHLVRPLEIDEVRIMSSTRASGTDQAAEKEEAALKTIDQLTAEHLRYIRWDYITFETILVTLRNPSVFPSVTLESLMDFYRYAKHTLRDYAGTTNVLRLLERGFDAKGRLQGDKFRDPVYTNALPNWHLTPEVINDISARRLWTHPNPNGVLNDKYKSAVDAQE